MAEPLSAAEIADVRAKYGPTLHGELHVDLESGEVTGDAPMLAFWNGVIAGERNRREALERAVTGGLRDHYIHCGACVAMVDALVNPGPVPSGGA